MQWCLWNSGCPTWRLHTTKPYDSKTYQTPTDMEWLLLILNDSASDSYWARSSGGQITQHLLWLRRSEVAAAAVAVTKWAMLECCSWWSVQWWLKFLSRRYWCNGCLLFLLFRSLVDGGVIGVGSHSAFSLLALITINFENEKKIKQAIGRAILFQHKYFFKRRAQFTLKNTLQLLRNFALEADNFSSYFDHFQDEE